MVDIADVIYVHSEYYWQRQRTARADSTAARGPRECRRAATEERARHRRQRTTPSSSSASAKAASPWPIARRIRCSCSPRCTGSWATRRCPASKPADKEQALLPQLARRLEQLEMRLKIIEEEQRGGLDLTKFYEQPRERRTTRPPVTD